MSNIAKNLKTLLSKEHLSENELSRRIGVPQQVLNRMINGLNLNPKLTTISPIAKYFNISLQELIYEDLTQNRRDLKEQTPVKIPFIDITEMQSLGINHAISQASRFISIDMNKNKNYFATKMYDASMEPKFPIDSILIFEKDRLPYTGDFCLLKSDTNQYLFRQIMINKADKKFIKCLNSNCPDYTLLPLPLNLYVLATLLESRTSFIIH